MRNHWIIGMALGFVFLAGCTSRKPASVRQVSLRIYEVVDCTAGMVPMSLKGSTEKYCLATEPVVDEKDIKLVQVSHDEYDRVRLQLYFSVETGKFMRETTDRIYKEHLHGNSQGRMGIVVDGELISAPELRGVIADALVIDDAFSWGEAVRIADSLMARK